MIASRKRQARRRGPNITLLSTVLGYIDPKPLSKSLIDFRNARVDSDDFASWQDDQLASLASEFLAEHGRNLWNGRKPTCPVYPADEKFIYDTVFKIYRLQRRNQNDVLVKKRRTDNTSVLSVEDPSLPDTDDDDAEHETETLPSYPASSVEPASVSPQQPAHGRGTIVNTIRSIPIDPEILNDTVWRPVRVQRTRKRAFEEMEDAASADREQSNSRGDENAQRDPQSILNHPDAARASAPYSASPVLSNGAISQQQRQSAEDQARPVEGASVQPSALHNSTSSVNDMNRSTNQSSIHTQTDTSTCRPPQAQFNLSSIQSQTTNSPTVAYTSVSCQTTPETVNSAATQTTQTTQTKQRSISVQTESADGVSQTFTYEGYQDVFEGDPASICELLTKSFNSLEDKRVSLFREIQQMKPGPERATLQAIAATLKQLWSEFQKHASDLGVRK